LKCHPQKNFPARATARQFEFARDSFAFPNELVWEYQLDSVNGKMNFRRRDPKSEYAHRCFVLTRVARQFLYHARFDPVQESEAADTYRRLIRAVVSRNPRTPCETKSQIVIPGFSCLREFSVAWEKLLKAECGGAWRSYFLRSHWRMVFPISRGHQKRTADQLLVALRQSCSPLST